MIVPHEVRNRPLRCCPGSLKGIISFLVTPDLDIAGCKAPFSS